MKKSHILILFSALLLISLSGMAYAASDPFAKLSTLLDTMFMYILGIFKLEFLHGSMSNLVALMRFFIWIMLFTIFYFAANAIFNRGGGIGAQGGAGNRLPLILAFCLSSITAIFLPSSILIAIGIEYSTIIALVMLCLIPLAIIYVAYGIFHPNNWAGHLVRLIALLVCLWVISQIDSGIATNFSMFFLVPTFLFRRAISGGERK
jgi:hypothetical protein